MKKPGKGQGFSVHQLQLDWTPAKTDTICPLPPANASDENAQPQSPIGTGTAAVVAEVAETRQQPERMGHSDLVQVLPWDFVTTFPEPMPDAIEAGILSDEDAEPENVKEVHDELTRQLLKVLTEQDEIGDARRRGVDPKTGARPTSRGGQERLRTSFETEPARLQRAWQALMGSYEAAFGEEAAAAFDKAIRARHAGVAVIAEKQCNAPDKGTNATSVPATAANDAAAPDEGIHVKAVRGSPERTRRVIARLPVPRPLPQAVAAGHFGQDEQGRPINPGADEVREITLNHSEILIELLAEERDPRRSRSEADLLRLATEIQTETTKYAEDFGFAAAEQLLAYCRRQLLINNADSLRPGHKGR